MRRTFIALAALATVITTAEADVYKSVDAQGQVHYSDQWSPGAELIKSTTGARPAAQDSPAAAPAATNDHTPADGSKNAATKQVQQDMDAIKAEQCKQLKDQYAKVIRARRIYEANADSSAPKQYMSDADADAERVKTRQAMDEACSGGGN
jgi:hypothetical protein